jgi:hypothetical protein
LLVSVTTTQLNKMDEMDTQFLLLARYDARAIIPIETVCNDFFAHLSPQKLLIKVDKGEIALPIVRMETSQKSAKGVHISDLAAWIDARRAVAQHELRALYGRAA